MQIVAVCCPFKGVLLGGVDEVQVGKRYPRFSRMFLSIEA
jgi:hypothetical protein